ncbi:lipocalin-like domain-containing protein [Pararhodobacter zhoushanensis]|uniref:lipocalin-like domain-containing protein n=1 Tax=Pararhodobacter zhoushanensis TaxID=2479545 RepID=UPI000F8EDC0E|nr:lipocalin-like domain-containing protein [Pararhodobacter zhoushanensis]
MLQGTWKLLGWEIESEDGRVAHPFGPDATGLIHYTADGGMAACIARADRPRWSTGNPRKAPEGERLAAFESYFHYAGTWRIEERDGQTVVIHSVTHSLNPDFVGSEQVRNVDLQGDRLTLSAQEGPRHHRLRWRR